MQEGYWQPAIMFARTKAAASTKGGSYMGGVIDNSKLDDAITEDMTPKEYPLGEWEAANFAKYAKGQKHGTIIHFEGIAAANKWQL